MGSNRSRSYECSVVGEEVRIRLRNRHVGGFSGTEEPFVQCDQQDCQYVDRNEPPCPLRLELFAEQMQEREERARRRRDDDY